MTWNSTFKSPSKPLQRKTPLRAKKPMRKAAKTASLFALPIDKSSAEWLRKMKSRGMKGKAPTASQKRFHDLLASVVGCIACRSEGMYTDYVSIHHIDGRTKPDAHWLVLPLCGPHHQDAGIDGVIPVHPYKTRFEAAYGKQEDLLRESIRILVAGGFEVPDGALVAAGAQKECPTSVGADLSVAHV